MEGDFSDEEAMENPSITNFWATNLSSKSKVYEYTGESDAEENIETYFEIKGACLGIDVKNERNIVDITTEDADGNPLTVSIFSLKLDKSEQVNSSLTLQPPFKLELVQGSGPVSIFGSMTSTLEEDLSDEEDDDEDEDEEEEEKLPSLVKVEKNTSQKKKRPADSPLEIKPAKKKKNVEKEPVNEEDESDEEDSAMDASFELPSLNKEVSDDDDDEEDDEEDTEEDDDNDESDEDDDEEEEEEEESEEEVKPPPKMSAKNKSQPQKKTKGGLSQTPVPTKKSTKLSVMEPMSVPKSEGKKGSKSTPVPSIDQIKKKLLASPTLPKKMEKFSNMLKNNYKISDDNARKELWEYVQKNKK